MTDDEVLDNSLTGADINESALNLPSRARFVSVSGFDSRVAETTVPEGNYLVFIAANYRPRIGERTNGQGKRVCVSCSASPRVSAQRASSAMPGRLTGPLLTTHSIHGPPPSRA